MNIEILNKSLIGLDFLRLKDEYIPSIDDLLDYRNRVQELKNTQEYSDQYYQYEINAVDEILKIINDSK